MQSLKPRLYVHFDNPLSEGQLKAFDPKPTEVAKHSFYPLLGFSKIQRRLDFSVFPPDLTKKTRDIRYASHKDAAIYSRYCERLSPIYEKFLSDNDLGNCVLAYRSGRGSNVTMARNLFDEIRSKRACKVICVDISGFFDNIDHGILKIRLRDMLSVDRLSDDWFKVLKSLTNYSWVDKKALERALVRKTRKGRICFPAEFRSKVRRVIETNSTGKGIPQGSPLSGLLANIYMSEVDRNFAKSVRPLGGSYRRYSDDIAIVLPWNQSVSRYLGLLEATLSRSGLALNPKKTTVTRFRTGGGIKYEGKLLQYLGFTFNGKKTHIRPESMKRFYARMKVNIRNYVRSAYLKGLPKGELHQRVLIGRFTHWGDARNFVQYGFRAARELNAPEIRRQLRRHVPIFKNYWNSRVAKEYK